MAENRCCFVLSLVFGLLLAGVGIAAEKMDGLEPGELFPGASFDPGIPTQAKLLGFEPGSRPLRHAELLRYLTALENASPRAKLVTYSETYEGRPMVYLAISDEETIARLDAFRAEHAQRVDPRGRPESEDAGVLGDAKAVAWIAYGIHGDELSSVDAAVAVAYRFVAGEDERAQRMRREMLILIDPCENPDGRERFLAQTTAFAHAVPNPDTEDLSHTTVWPWGRGNHYLFDLNRDWLNMVQPESRRSAVIAGWNPQLVVDSHEMGAHDSYLFSPSRHPFNPFLPPSHQDWDDRFAADQARALAERGYAYYTREWNEEFFPGYGSSWASYLGAIGILYEMSGTEGTLVRQRGGTVRTYTQAVEHQVASSIANLGTLFENRRELLADYVADRRAAMRAASEGPVGAWLLPEGRHPERTRQLVGILRDQGITVLRNSGRPPKVSGLHDARTGDAVDSASLPEINWLVPLDQPGGPLVHQLIDPHIPMRASFLREEREWLERGKGSRIYEVTAWSLVLGYGIEAYWTSQRPSAGWEEQDSPGTEGGLGTVAEPFGYLFDGVTDRSAPAVADLLQRGIAVRVAEKPFAIGGRAYERGALLIKREGNPDDLERQLDEVAERWSIRIEATSTAKSEKGPDLGGEYFHALVAPRIGIWTGVPVSPSAYGALWHLLDKQVPMRFSGLDLARFDDTDLSRYNVLVFPPAWGGVDAYWARIGEEGVERLRRWIEAGGTAIGIGGGAAFLADGEIELTRTRLRSQALERFPPVVLGLSPHEAMAAGPFRAAGIRAPGTETEDDESTSKKKNAPAPVERESPYDVAPLIGPGARPFVAGIELGTPGNLPPVGLATWLEPFLPPGRAAPDAEDLERGDTRLRRFRPRGAYLNLELDPELWLAWGLPDELPALVRSADTLVAVPPVQVPARFDAVERLHLGGLLWPEAAGRLTKTAYLTRESVGRGQVILFLNEPEIRGWTLGTRRLLLNALLYGPGLGTSWSTPW